jgi:hypothetical protein
MDGVKTATESHLVGLAWIKSRAEDPVVVAMCITPPIQCDRVTLSERARQVEPASESGASHE